MLVHVTTRVLLEDTWEADDVKEECIKHHVPCDEMTVIELEQYSTLEFVQSTYMCNTELIQRKLAEVGLLTKVPSTYPDSLFGLLKRSVEQRTLKDLKLTDLPVFVKPVSNDKSFDGRVVTDEGGLEHLLEDGGHDLECPIWAAERVSFLVEHRLFVGGGKLYGMGRIQGSSDALPDESFISEVLSCCGPDVFWAVDVGLLVRANTSGKQEGHKKHEGNEEQECCWAVVEVNPPFALDDHGLAIGPYCRFCQDACAWIRQ